MRDLEEKEEKIEDLERTKKQLQAELDELINSQGTADKNVGFNFCIYYCIKLSSIVVIK